MWMYCFQRSSTRAISFISEGGECVWSHLFWSRSGARGGGPHQHGPAPDSQQRHPVSCDALLGLHWRTTLAWCLLSVVCKGLACVWSLLCNRRPCIPLTTSPARRWVTRGEEKRVKFAPSGSSKEYTFQQSNAFMPLPRNLYHSKEQREHSQGLFSLSLIEFDRSFNMQRQSF